MSAKTTWALPPVLREGIAVIPETGLYASESEFLAEAVRTLLAARPDLREALACKLYERAVISLGKAAELSGLNLEDTKRALHRHGISRVAPESLSETEALACAAIELAARSVQ